MTLPEALARSCDTYFYQVGTASTSRATAAGSRMQDWAHQFGFGAPPGSTSAREADGARADAGLAEEDVQERLGPAWNPGDSIQLAIGQKDVTGDAAPDGALLRDDRERRQARHPVRRLAGRDSRRPSGQSPVVEQRFAPDPPVPSGVDPAALDVIRDGLYSATHSTLRHVVRRLRQLPDRRRRQDGNGREGRPDPRLPDRPHRGPVVVVRLRPGADRGRAPRRLRRDRERRPRLDGGCAGRAARVREVLRREGEHPDPCEHRLMIVDAGRQRLPLRHATRRPRGAPPPPRPRPAARRRRARRLRALGGVGHHAVRRPGRPRLLRRRVRRSPPALGSVGLVVAIAIPPSRLPAPLARALRRHDRADGARLRVRRGDPRLEALDRARPDPVPAVGVREGALRARARRASSSSGTRRLGQLRTVAAAMALGAVADAARLPPARPRHGARLRGGALRRCSSSQASAGCISRLLAALAPTLVARVLWFLPAAGVEVLKPYQTARVTGFANPDADPCGLDLQRHAVDHGGRRGRPRGPRRERGEPDPASTTSPSTRPTSCSPRSPSSADSSAPRSCSSSTCSSSGAACA